jgi:thioredoxin-dependent peroxiredoxin
LVASLALTEFFYNNGGVMTLNPIMLNQTVADFELAATSNKIFRLSEYRNKILVIYFYPKDNTPGCTDEGRQFRDLYPSFLAAGAEIFGISRDNLKSHESFKAKFSLPFGLLCDSEEEACRIFSVIKLKNMYGKQVRGIERSTFVLDGGGVLRCEWRGVKVDGHAQEVLDFVKTL